MWFCWCKPKNSGWYIVTEFDTYDRGVKYLYWRRLALDGRKYLLLPKDQYPWQYLKENK